MKKHPSILAEGLTIWLILLGLMAVYPCCLLTRVVRDQPKMNTRPN